MDLGRYDDDGLIELYCDVLNELKERRIIRSKNVIGDLGERMALKYYHESKDFPNLKMYDTNMQHVDAYSTKGNKSYSIKATTTGTTGVVRSVGTPEDPTEPEKLFDYMIIVKFDDNFRTEAVYEIDWKTFLEERHWHSTMKAWNIVLTQRVKDRAKLVYGSPTRAVNNCLDNY